MASPARSAPEQSDKGGISIRQKELKTTETTDGHTNASHNENNRLMRQRNGGVEPSIGWMVPFTIIGGFLAAIVVAVVHYVYCHHLDKKFVYDTIPQSWSSVVSNALAHLFAAALVTSASVAFTQLLWWYLRRRSLSVSKIDALFSLNSSSSNLYQLRLLKAVPVLWLFGLIIPLISIATIFPPGSLIIDQLPYNVTEPLELYTLNIDNRGDGSVDNFFAYAYFVIDSDGAPQFPDPLYTRIAARTIRQQAYDLPVSDWPCGANCTYDLTFPAPALRCEDDTPNIGLEETVLTRYGNETFVERVYKAWNPERIQYMASTYVLDDQFKFDISFRGLDKHSLQNISCTILSATYIAHVEYHNWIQNVTLDVEEGKPLNPSALEQVRLFEDVLTATQTSDGFTYSDSPVHNFTMPELFQLYHDAQLLAISQTLTRSLAGAISGYGTANYFTMNTIIEDTMWAASDYNRTSGLYTDLSILLTASVVEELMKNITISILNYHDQDFVTAPAHSTTYETAYIFSKRLRLIAAYTSALAVAFVFILAGLVALHQNGTPASSGGFLQIMCTTTHGDGVMNQLAKQNSLSAPSGVAKDLSDLKIRFGVVTNSDGRHAAFGTVDETEILLKGA